MNHYKTQILACEFFTIETATHARIRGSINRCLSRPLDQHQVVQFDAEMRWGISHAYYREAA